MYVVYASVGLFGLLWKQPLQMCFGSFWCLQTKSGILASKGNAHYFGYMEPQCLKCKTYAHLYFHHLDIKHSHVINNLGALSHRHEIC